MATTATPSAVTAVNNGSNGYDTGVHYNAQHHVAKVATPQQQQQQPHSHSAAVQTHASRARIHHQHSHSAPHQQTAAVTTQPQFPSPPPHLQLPLRNCRQLKSPLYVPAVLRRTDWADHRPPSARNSPGNSSDGSPPKSGGPSSPESGRSMFPYLSRAGNGGEVPSSASTARTALERRDTEVSFESTVLSRAIGDEWNEEPLGPVTGPPTRNHWKPDLSSTTCNFPGCDTAFTFFTRRHHCRRCGHIFCAPHSLAAVPLDQHARFHPRAPAHRACDACWRDYCVWEAVRSRGASEAGSAEGSERAAGGIAAPGNTNEAADRVGPMGGVKIGAAAARAKQEGRFGSLSQSFGREWSWSTF